MWRSMSPRHATMVVEEIGRTLWRRSNHGSIISATVLDLLPRWWPAAPASSSAWTCFAPLQPSRALAGHWAANLAFTAGQRVPAVTIGALAGHCVTPGPALLPSKE